MHDASKLSCHKCIVILSPKFVSYTIHQTCTRIHLNRLQYENSWDRVYQSTSRGGCKHPRLLFCIQILKNYSTSEYGFLKIFATCEQWVRIYRTYYSFGCKNNIIILIEDIYTLSPHSLYTVQTTLSSSHSFSSITLLPLSPTCRSSTTHATPITLFPSTFFSLFTILLYPLIEDSRVVGLILRFVWNFWVSQWWSVWRVVEVWLESTGVGLKWLTLVCVLVVWISGWFCD